MPLPSELFLSHATPDRKFADRLAGVLRAHGLPVWYSRTNLVGAQQWHDEIGQALGRCDAFVLLLSPDAVQPQWVKLVYMFALSNRRYRDRIVPVLLAACDTVQLSWTLDTIQRVDFTAGFDEGCRGLLRVWGLGYAGEVRPPNRRQPAGPKAGGSRRRGKQ